MAYQISVRAFIKIIPIEGESGWAFIKGYNIWKFHIYSQNMFFVYLSGGTKSYDYVVSLLSKCESMLHK